MGAPHNHRRLTLILSAFVLISNTCLAFLFHRLPDDDPYHLASRLSIYSYFASALGVLGFVGARRGNATLVAIFANYLLIDILICTIPRLLALSLFPSLRETICDAESIQNFIFSQSLSSSPSHAFAWSSAPALSAGFDDDPTTRLESQSVQLQSQCLRIVSVVSLLISAVVVTATVVQVVCAIRVSAYAAWLAKLEDQAAHEADSLAKSPATGRFRSGSGRSLFSDDGSRHSGAWEREEEKRAELEDADVGWRKC